MIINRIPFFYISLSTSKLFSYNIQIHHQNPLLFLSNYSCYLETFFFLFYYEKSCTSWKNGQRQIHTKWYFYNLLDSNVQHEYQHVNALYKIQNEKKDFLSFIVLWHANQKCGLMLKRFWIIWNMWTNKGIFKVNPLLTNVIWFDKISEIRFIEAKILLKNKFGNICRIFFYLLRI